MKKKTRDLPDECWEMIFKLLGGHHRNLEPLSLVSKNFLSITNRMRTHFDMITLTFLFHTTISPFLARFHNLTSISLAKYLRDLNEPLLQIAASALKIETLDISGTTSFPTDGLAPLGKTVRVLKCSGVRSLGDSELAFIADSFPLLEELDISFPRTKTRDRDGSATITETGIEQFASRVTKKLRKIDVSGNSFVGDKSILAILLNCFHLSEIKFLGCPHVTHNVFQFLVRKSSKDYSQINPAAFPGNQSFRVLSSLHICSALITDEFLISIANAGLPLKKLTLNTYNSSSFNTFTFSGLSSLLQTYPSLDYLALNGLAFLDDSSLAVLSAYFRCLIKIKLLVCVNLSYSSLFMLIKSCPFLEDIEMQIYRGKRHLVTDSVENPRIKSLNLSSSVGLIDRCLFLLSSICTKLEWLDVATCPRISNRGLGRILNKCTEIRHLDISYCDKITGIGMGGILKNLKVLEMSGLEIDKTGLIMIGTRCTGLVRLRMMECTSKKIITGDISFSNCKMFKHIHMGDSYVSPETFDSIISSMPSLMMAVPPTGSILLTMKDIIFAF